MCFSSKENAEETVILGKGKTMYNQKAYITAVWTCSSICRDKWYKTQGKMEVKPWSNLSLLKSPCCQLTLVICLLTKIEVNSSILQNYLLKTKAALSQGIFPILRKITTFPAALRMLWFIIITEKLVFPSPRWMVPLRHQQICFNRKARDTVHI